MGLGSKLAIFARRAKSASLRRMNQNIRVIHRETGKSRTFLFCDMIWCTFRYHIGYLEYHVFGFANNRGKNRKTFMTMNHNVALARMVNDRSCYPILNDKFQFLEHYRPFLGRQWLDLRTSTVQDLNSFCKAHPVVFAKPHADFGGKGVECLVCDQTEDYEALYNRLMEGKQYLIEEAICQHEELNRLCPSSVNTLRVVTLLINGQAKYVYSLLRMGSGQSHVDNISSGGMYTLIGDDGKMHFPAFCDKTGLYYDAHPCTGTHFEGYCLPYFKESIDLCKQAALVEPRLGYIGWDVAITPNGPVLVEGNNLPGYDMAQNARFHPDGIGLLPLFESLVEGPIPKA